MKRVHRILCRLFGHRWAFKFGEYSNGEGWLDLVCSRCGKWNNRDTRMRVAMDSMSRWHSAVANLTAEKLRPLLEGDEVVVKE